MDQNEISFERKLGIGFFFFVGIMVPLFNLAWGDGSAWLWLWLLAGIAIVSALIPRGWTPPDKS